MDALQAFRRNPDGSWTCTNPVTFCGPNGRIQVTAGSTFAPGSKFMNVDLAMWLEEQKVRVGPAAPEPTFQ